MTRKVFLLAMCMGLASPFAVHAIQWEPIGGEVRNDSGSSNGYYYQRQQDPQPRYESNTGTQYQYDLNNPIDQNSYSLDLDAQRRDMQSADPRRNTDRSFGQHGGGIYR